jgi:hypothetical protein
MFMGLKTAGSMIEPFAKANPVNDICKLSFSSSIETYQVSWN